MPLLRQGLVWVFRRVMGIYFREIEAAGEIPAPDAGGRLFVSNHVNALVDPILVLTSAPCPISPVAKSTLWSVPGLRWLLDAAGAVPIVRRSDDPGKGAGANDEVFDRIASFLAGGGNILIFPEGTSHSAPHLLTVKTGAARMLARAFARGGRDVSLQAVALEFDERHLFRSRCLLIYGPVRRVADVGLEGDALVEALTAALQRDLSELLVEGATWPERVLIARVAEMLANDAGDRSLAHWSTIGREVERARKMLAGVDEPTVERVGAAVERYYARLGQEGLTDEELTTGADPRARGRTRRGAALLLLLPLALAGVALYWLPYQLPRLVAARAKEPDEVSTLKLGAGLAAFPLWAAALVAVAIVLLPPPLAAATALVALASPFAALAWLDRTPRLRRRLRFASRRARFAELRLARGQALELIARARQRLGI